MPTIRLGEITTHYVEQGSGAEPIVPRGRHGLTQRGVPFA